MRIIVTGGTGFIGSHTCVELQKIGHEVTIIDNLSNSDISVLQSIESISGKHLDFKKIDMLDFDSLSNAFATNEYDAVIHFAGLKAVGESVATPLRYYQNNVQGTLNLLEAMAIHNVQKLIFSSSATVYSPMNQMPLDENADLCPTNPYGRTKLMIEQICRDVCASDPEMQIVLLRYFNPVGAHESGLIGENPVGVPNNLFPYISQTARGKREYLSIYGNDYDTPDGTGIRDYIHVVDLAHGHVKALDAELCNGQHVFNLGTGIGFSVLDAIHAFERVNGVKVPYRFVDRRPGDVAVCYSDPSKAKEALNWEAKRNLEQMCFDAWNFEIQMNL